MKMPAPPQSEGTGRSTVKRRRVRVSESMNIGWAVIISMYYAVGSTAQVSYDALGPKYWTRVTSRGFLAALKTI